MTGLPAWLLADTVTVEAKTGSAPNGPVFANPATIRCLVEVAHRRVVTTTGEATTVEITVYAPPQVTAPPGSRITLPDGGGTATVVTCAHLTGGPLHLPDHTEITCK